jgi:hypothetical protein
MPRFVPFLHRLPERREESVQNQFCHIVLSVINLRQISTRTVPGFGGSTYYTTLKK